MNIEIAVVLCGGLPISGCLVGYSFGISNTLGAAACAIVGGIVGTALAIGIMLHERR